jgi:tRNA pseudouridine38-40 synthase
MNVPSTIINEMCGPQKVIVPRAPALGLLLEYPVFEKYNSRMQDISDGVALDDNLYRPPIEFDQYSTTIEDFKTEFIYRNMREQESRDAV